MAIHVLAPDVVDKIAAGEVLERPANLIKELVENSLDAGATEIEIEFDQGGREARVQDNGSGMSRADLALAVVRHATSKITASEDLFHLHSFGFRGEALASVAAVSRLALTSRQAGQETAYRLDCEFGKCGEPVAVSARTGTEVRVRDLFANVPARLRFLKSEAAEHTAIKTAIKALALANPNVAFRILSRHELVFHWPLGQTFAERARSVLGLTLYPGHMTSDGLEAQILVSSPEDTLNVNRGLWFFVQGRWVQDRSLSAAVMEGYRNLLMHGEYPTVVARLEIAPEEVDVNVHPTKAQVKFREPQVAFRTLCRAVREVLETAPWLGPRSHRPAASLTSAYKEESSSSSSPLRFSAPEFERTQYSTKVFPLAQVREAVRHVPVETVSHSPLPDQAFKPSEAQATSFRWANLHVIGQIHQTYILAQSQEAMYLIDQHAAHERIVFERLMQDFRSGRMDVQNLLLPLVFDFSEAEVECLSEHRDAIDRLGLTIERLGPESLAVQAIPALVSESAIAEALRKLADELAMNAGSFALERVIGEIFASMACHSVVRAGQPQSLEQMVALLAQMDEFPLSSFCPHGRPVHIRRTFGEIEREFGRIV